MPKNVDGEFEVLLGNKQLLSVFFIVVILLAVFFTMGYVVGKSASPSGGSAQTAATVLPPAKERPLESAPAPSVPETTGASVPAAEPTRAQTAPAAAALPPHQQPPPVTEPAKPAAPRPSKSVAETGPTPGAYLQATAAKRSDAELVASVLKKKGLPVVLAPGPTEAVLRVLVGPFSDVQALSKARAELETAGFKPFRRNY